MLFTKIRSNQKQKFNGVDMLSENKCKTPIIVLLSLLVTICNSTIVEALNMQNTSWYVAPASLGGSNSNNGTSIAAPLEHIQIAVSKAFDGDTIKVLDDDNESTDDYIENITVDKSLSIAAYDDDGTAPRVKAKKSTDHIFHITANGISIKGLDIYGTEEPAAGIYLDHVEFCTIENNRCGWDMMYTNFHGIALLSSKNNSILNNTCNLNRVGVRLSESQHNFLLNNTCGWNLYGIMLSSSNDNSIGQNTIEQFSGYGISVYNGDYNVISGNTCTMANLNGTGIDLRSAANNNITGNTVRSALIGLFVSVTTNESKNNTIAGNIFESNKTGIQLRDSENDRIYLNNFKDNTTDDFYQENCPPNPWQTPTQLGFYYDSSMNFATNYMGNYYSQHVGNDVNNDGIGDSPYSTRYFTDEYPLMYMKEQYDLQAWFLACDPNGDLVMYQGDMATAGDTVRINQNASITWRADKMTRTKFEYDNDSDALAWTGQLMFWSPPTQDDHFKIEIGYADQNSNNFVSVGTETILARDNSTTVFIFTTNAASFTIPEGNFLALRITNNNNSEYTIRVGGSQSYCSLNKVQGNNAVDDSKTIVKEYSLYQNYPNPFNSTTIISYSVAKKSHVKLTVYNTLGQIVAELVNGYQAQGSYSVTWDAMNQPSGLYLCRFEADSFAATKKMFLQK